MADQAGYRNIFKSTFLFGFVQIFNIAVKVGLNKVVAILLGPSGMGVISLYNTTIQMLSTGAGLGINQSAVRDIADVRGTNDSKHINTVITFVKKIIRYTSLFGIVVMAAMSPVLSEWTFKNKDYTIAYLFLSLAVGATIQTNGFRAINTGMRDLRSVAYSTMWGSVAGLVSALPFYFFWGERGIVPSLIISSLSTLMIAKYYANKVKYDKVKMSLKEALSKSSNMIKMGVSLMIMSLMLSVVQLIISSYISRNGGLSIVGLYQAGATIVTSYFGIIVTAMSTEYYPRISSFNQDNAKLNIAVNTQSEIGLLIALPLMVLFVFLAPYFIQFLYSSEFINATEYLDYAIFGTIAIICSNCMGMILLAKQASKIFLISSLFGNIITLTQTLLLYNYFGLTGLGISYAINGLMQFVMYDLIMRHYYKIKFSLLIVITLIGTFVCCGVSTCLRTISIDWIRWASGFVLLITTATYSLHMLNRRMEINLITKVISIIIRK